jgi:cytochrome c-type biogenesis protein
MDPASRLLLGDLGEWMKMAVGGSMLLAIPVAALAGLVSFFSPCVLPLLPGYLSYATGLSVSDITTTSLSGQRRRMLAGTSLFILGFACVFVSSGALFGSLGAALVAYRRPISIAIGIMSVLLGLVFAGLVPLWQGTLRLARAPRLGLAAAPFLGLVFGLGWTPCMGPTLSVVLTLALNEATALRGALLALAYALGLGLPFMVAGLAFTRLTGTLGWVRRHHLLLQRTGGGVLVGVGLLLVTGAWDALVVVLQRWAVSFGVAI